MANNKHDKLMGIDGYLGECSRGGVDVCGGHWVAPADCLTDLCYVLDEINHPATVAKLVIIPVIKKLIDEWCLTTHNCSQICYSTYNNTEK